MTPMNKPISYAHHTASAAAASDPTSRIVVGSISAASGLVERITDDVAGHLLDRFDVRIPDLAAIVDAAVSPVVVIDVSGNRSRFTGDRVRPLLWVAEAIYNSVRSACDDERLRAEFGFSSFLGRFSATIIVDNDDDI